MKIAYLTNQYPKVSHSFVRREIAALEADAVGAGDGSKFEILRYSIRRVDEAIVDPADQREQDLTHYVLDHWPLGLVWATLVFKLTHPIKYFKAAMTMFRLGRASDRGVMRHVIYLMEACWLARRFQAEGIEHVHVHFGTNPASVMLLVHQLTGVDYSITCHGPEEFDKPLEACLQEKIENAKFVVGVSSFGRSQLYRRCGYEHWPRVHVLHCGVGDDYLKADLTAIPERRNLVCLGRICEQKGQLLLIRAAANLAAEGCDFHLTFVGDGEMRPELERLIDEFKMTDRVTITGWQSGEEVRQAMLDCRAMVLPSFAEGLPVAIMEALALGRPVISTYIAGIPELVDQACGWMVPAGSVEDLTDAMRGCLAASDATLAEMGRCGAERVGRRHSVNHQASRLAAMIRGEVPGPAAQSTSPSVSTSAGDGVEAAA